MLIKNAFVKSINISNLLFLDGDDDNRPWSYESSLLIF
jgi:hypothetical protein